MLLRDIKITSSLQLIWISQNYPFTSFTPLSGWISSKEMWFHINLTRCDNAYNCFRETCHFSAAYLIDSCGLLTPLGTCSTKELRHPSTKEDPHTKAGVEVCADVCICIHVSRFTFELVGCVFWYGWEQLFVWDRLRETTWTPPVFQSHTSDSLTAQFCRDGKIHGTDKRYKFTTF